MMALSDVLCNTCAQITLTFPPTKTEVPIREYAGLEELAVASKNNCTLCRMIELSHESHHQRYNTFDFQSSKHSEIKVFHRKYEHELESNISWRCESSKPRTLSSESDTLGGFFTDDESSHNVIPGHAVPDDPSSEMCFGLARKWLNECRHEHPSCAVSEVVRLPTRVIDVALESGRSANSSFLFITSSDEQVGDVRYAALSYCWGGPQSSILTSRNIDGKQRDICFDKLGKTIQDAIEVTRRLGIRYLWVDSQCIIQDSVEDWQKESAQMGSIYHNAEVTIKISGARDSYVGCLVPRPKPRIPHAKLKFVTTDGTNRAVFVRYDKIVDEFLVEPLDRRGWTFQESLLSRRILSYGERQMSWECKLAYRSESGNPVEPTSYFIGLPKPIRRSMKFDENTPQEPHIPSTEYTTLRTWQYIVQNFTSRILTFPTDRLPALAGIARHISETRSQDTYLAGLWRNDLPLFLLWSCGPGAASRPATYRAPSWSWASLDGAIGGYESTSMQRNDDVYCAVLNACVTPKGLNPWGEVCDGYIELRGPIKEAWRRMQTAGDRMGFLFPENRQLEPSESAYVVKLALCQMDLPGPDLGSNKPVSALCIRITIREGLILRPLDDGKFERAGTFDLDEEKAHWFDDAVIDTVIVV